MAEVVDTDDKTKIETKIHVEIWLKVHVLGQQGTLRILWYYSAKNAKLRKLTIGTHTLVITLISKKFILGLV